MSQADPPTGRPRADPDDLPRHTTPTWEVELLISGLAVFAMLQLPSWLGDRFLLLIPRFDSHWANALNTVYVYLAFAAVILAVTFALHLLLRAHWIALVGMHSVYPDGVRWEKLRAGPLRRAAEQRQCNSTEDAIERADNRASILFAVGVMLASWMLLTALLAGVVFAATIAVTTLSTTKVNPVYVFPVLIGVLVVPMWIAHVVDRRFGEKLRSDGMTYRVLAAMLKFYTRIHLGRGSYVMTLVSSHNGERRVSALIMLVFMVAALPVAFGFSAKKNPWLIGNYTLLARLNAHSERTISPAHYDDQRDTTYDQAVPFIQSPVISEAYLQLFVPYRPTRDTPALRSQCATALALSNDDARASATLDCLAHLHTASLDGEPLTPLHYDLGSDPRTERPALIAMIDVRALPPGRHVLRVTNPPRPDRSDDDKAADNTTVIPFWR